MQGASQDTAGARDALASAAAASLGILTAATAVALGVAELAFDFTTLSTVGKALSERFEGCGLACCAIGGRVGTTVAAGVVRASLASL